TKTGWFIPESVSGLKRKGCPDKAGIDVRFAPVYAIPISRFIVWWRVRAAIEQLSKSATLTEAAHASGFSDLPHMSKTFKQLFGFAPSSLFKPHTIKIHSN
ncbi:helix-turn-helix domain-containing protein, partial [Alteromonas oceani]